MSTSSPTYDIRVILPHPSAQRVLLCPASGGGWELPRWVTSERHFWQSAGYVDDGVRELLGISVTTLRCLWTAYDRERACSVRWYELENVGSGEEPRQGEWRGTEALGDLVDAQDRALLAEWLREVAQGVPERRRPWARRGWFAQAVTWIDEQLAQLGVSRVGPVEQVRTWERGCVLRVPATGGSLYFKALPAMFGHEIRLIEMLARVRPSAVVTVLALDRERQWMLMADMGDHALDGVAELARWEEALRDFARLQIVTAADPAALLALGCPDRRVETLAEQIDPFFAALEQYPNLSPEEIARLRALAPRLRADCTAPANCDIPAALEHGDFWPGNIMVGDGGYVYFDWSDSSLSHPFFSLTLFLELDDIPHALPCSPDRYSRLRDAYLAPWSRFATRDELLRTFELARRVGPLHLALLYDRILLPNMEARWEMENMVGYYLKMLLRERLG